MKSFTFFLFVTFVLQMSIIPSLTAQNKWISNSQASLDTAQQIWVARYNGAGNNDDIALAIVADDSGNVYITGGSANSVANDEITTIKYNAAGQEIWNIHYNAGIGVGFGRAIAIDNQGNLIVAGQFRNTISSTGSDYITIKYSPSGVQLWASVYNGTGNSDDNIEKITLDQLGNIFVTGESFGDIKSQNDIVTIKYNSSGVQQWVASYSGSGNGNDYVNGIALDGSGNIYVAGAAYASSGNYDFVTIKYNPAGQQQWASTYNGSGNGYDGIWSLAVDDSGNAYVVGRSTGTGTGEDYAIIKYNTLGIAVWIALYNGPGNSTDQPYGIAVDDSGNAYVTGTSMNVSNNNDIATIKYNKNGVQQWVTRYNGPHNNYDAAYALIIDKSRNSYVTGTSSNAGTSYDYCTIKYNTNGVRQWIMSYDGGVGGLDYALAITMDHSDNIYITGQSWGSHYDFATVRYHQFSLTPAAPANLSAVTDTLFVRLNWNDKSNNESGFKIERKDTSIAPWTLIDSVGADITTYKNTELTPGKKYSYRIYAYNAFGNSEYSNSITVDTYTPVELTSFIANYSDQGALLTWTTATEINNRGFEIEKCQKSEQTTVWGSIGFVNGAGTTVSKNTYSYLDNKISAGIFIYRLKQVDFDGAYSYSDQIEVNIDNPKGYTLKQNYPNPFNPTTRINYTLPYDSKVILEVYNITGERIGQLVNEDQPAGYYSVNFNSSSINRNISSGVYFYKIIASYKTIDKNFTSIKKMILLK